MILALMLSAATASLPAAEPRGADLAAACRGRDGWADPAPPAHVFGNVWYVGTCGITVLLVTSPQGHVLIDGGPAEAAPLVAANIARLGFALRDVRWIVSSHEHEDHVGALAALQRITGARVAALAAASPALASGKVPAEDPQRAVAKDFAPVRVDRLLSDGEVLRLGTLALTVHATPAHSRGSASWTWRSCVGAACQTITYADSATVISADGYRFRDHRGRLIAADAGLAKIGVLPCGVLITPHPSASDLFPRLAGEKPLADAGACRAYAAAARARFDKRLADEATGGEAAK